MTELKHIIFSQINAMACAAGENIDYRLPVSRDFMDAYKREVTRLQTFGRKTDAEIEAGAAASNDEGYEHNGIKFQVIE